MLNKVRLYRVGTNLEYAILAEHDYEAYEHFETHGDPEEVKLTNAPHHEDQSYYGPTWYISVPCGRFTPQDMIAIRMKDHIAVKTVKQLIIEAVEADVELPHILLIKQDGNWKYAA